MGFSQFHWAEYCTFCSEVSRYTFITTNDEAAFHNSENDFGGNAVFFSTCLHHFDAGYVQENETVSNLFATMWHCQRPVFFWEINVI